MDSLTFSNKSGIIFCFSETGKISAEQIAKAASTSNQGPTNIAPSNLGTQIANWDVDNLFPKKIKDAANSNPKVKKAIDARATHIIGKGVALGVSIDEVFTPKTNADFQEFNRLAMLTQNYLFPAAKDIVQYAVAYVSIVLNNKRTKIARVKTQPAHSVRLGVQNQLTGLPDFAYLSAYWEEGVTISDTKKVKAIPMIDASFDIATSLSIAMNQHKKSDEFMLMLRYPSDEFIYPIPTWWPVKNWIDVSNNVASYKNWLFKNLSAFSHIVYIHQAYWPIRFADWNQLMEDYASDNPEKSAVAKTKLNSYRTKLIDEINDLVCGQENTAKIHVADILADYISKSGDIQAAKSIVIEAVPKINWSNEFNPDVQEADAQILFAFGLDAAIQGSQPGTSNQGGSNKSQSYNIAQVSNYIEEELLLSVYRLIRDFNKYDPNLDFNFRRVTIATMDSVAPKDRVLNS
jgi:hypothetical protein